MTAPATLPPPSPRAASAWHGKTRRDQLFFLLLGAGLLAGSAVMQPVLADRRASWNLVQPTPESEKSFRSLAINFPRLTMGGFRGLLSTILWQQAEEDKNERRWIDLETKYDIIGALQPYFVSVYIFHSWNLAYNLSAQWQEQDIKYKWVLDGLAYLYRGEDYNPGRPDIYLEEAHLYFLKLGGAFERIFFRQHWRDDLARLHQLNDNRTTKSDATVALQHVRHFVGHRDARNSENYFNLTELPDPERKQPGTGWGVQITDPFLFSARTDGKKPADPMEFRYGLSPYYFAYCEYKRSIAAGGPTSAAFRIVDAWPAMSLRLWCRDDCYYTYQSMNALFGPKPDPELLKPEAFAAKVSELHDCFRNVQTVGPRAIQLFNEHLGRFPYNVFVHTKHIKETEAFIAISKAEISLFDALVKWHVNGRKLTPELVTQFQQADDLYQAAFKTTMVWVDTLYPVVEGQPANPDRADNEKYALALQARSKGIRALLILPATEKPDMSFFADEVIEK